MGRDMPVYCPHGKVVDWGDFGPEDGTRPPKCPDCITDRARAQAERRERAIVAAALTLAACGAGYYDHGLSERAVAERVVDAVLESLGRFGRGVGG